MTHTRYRKFNTRDTYPEQRLDNDPATELRIVERELREIAALRLVRGLADA